LYPTWPPKTPPVIPTTFSTKTKWQAKTTPRLGLAWNDVLFYGKAGIAAGEVDASTNRLPGSGSAAPASLSVSQQRVGWTAGAGIEWAFTRNWILGIEYDYVNFGTQNYAGYGFDSGGNSRFVSEDVNVNYSEILGRLSYKF
jgi:outer membrane immunogenic protein